ncbi:MAG: protein-disulfide reductase DsbD domain-containing protein [Bacteroidota bacterium]
MKHLLLIVCYCLTLCGFSQIAQTQAPLKPVTWMVSYVEKSPTEGEIVFTATIDKKWHIYSQKQPTDVGPIPTSFTIAPGASYELVGKVEEEQPHEEYVAAFEAKVLVFSGHAIFKQKIKRKNKDAFTVESLLEFMTCNDIQCLPPSISTFMVNVPAVK